MRNANGKQKKKKPTDEKYKLERKETEGWQKAPLLAAKQQHDENITMTMKQQRSGKKKQLGCEAKGKRH